MFPFHVYNYYDQISHYLKSFFTIFIFFQVLMGLGDLRVAGGSVTIEGKG